MTGNELLSFVESKIGTEYFYGMKGAILTEALYNQMRAAYGSSLVLDSDKSKIGKVCTDCSGLFSWATGVYKNSSAMRADAIESHPISEIQNAPIGATLWNNGHVGIYVGDGVHYIASDDSAHNVRKNKIVNSSFTHWQLQSYIDYIQQDSFVEVPDKVDLYMQSESVEVSEIIIDGQRISVDRILHGNTNYIKIRDIAEALGYTVGFEGNIATLTKNF